MTKKTVRPRRGWKVLQSNLYSLVANDRAHVYSFDEYIVPRPGFGPLTVLKTKKAAQHIVNNYEGDRYIFSCLYYPSTEEKVWSPFIEASFTIKKLEDSNKALLLPGQTVLANKVKLLRKNSLNE